MERTADEARAEYTEHKDRDLGEVYAGLWQEVASIHSKWSEYVELYGTKESRLDLLNRLLDCAWVVDGAWLGRS